MAVLLVGCKTKERVVTVEKVRNDTTYITKHQRDSVWLHDSIHVTEKGDTIRIERWHTKYVEKATHDTLYQHKTDSVPVPYPVEKPLTRWQQFCLDYGKVTTGATAALLLLLIALAIKRFSIKR